MNGNSSTRKLMDFIQAKRALVFASFMMCAFAVVILKDNPFPKVLLLAGAMVGGAIFLLSGFFRLDVLIYLFVTYLPFSHQVPIDFKGIPGLNGTNLFIAFITFFWFTKRDKSEPLFAKTPLNVPIYLFAAFGLFSIFRSLGYGPGFITEAGLEYYRLWVVPLFLYFLIYNAVRDRETVENVAIMMMLVIAMTALMAVYDYLSEDDRVGGVFDQPNVLAFFFSYGMFFFLAFFLLNSRKRPMTWGFLLPFLICFRGIMVTFSRAGYLTFAVGVYAITYFRSKFLIVLLILGTLFLFRNPVFLPEGVRYRLAQTIERKSIGANEGALTTETLDKSTSDRIKLWKASKAMIKDHPVLGVGFHQFEAKVLHYWTGTEQFDPHNSYLLIAAEMGIPALLVLLWIFWRIFWSARAVYRKTQDRFVKALALGFLGGFFAFLVSNLYGSRIYYPDAMSYFWIFAALLMRLRAIEDGKKKVEDGPAVA